MFVDSISGSSLGPEDRLIKSYTFLLACESKFERSSIGDICSLVPRRPIFDGSMSIFRKSFGLWWRKLISGDLLASSSLKLGMQDEVVISSSSRGLLPSTGLAAAATKSSSLSTGPSKTWELANWFDTSTWPLLLTLSFLSEFPVISEKFLIPVYLYFGEAMLNGNCCLVFFYSFFGLIEPA